jgi:hypothetical protein
MRCRISKNPKAEQLEQIVNLKKQSTGYPQNVPTPVAPSASSGPRTVLRRELKGSPLRQKDFPVESQSPPNESELNISDASENGKRKICTYGRFFRAEIRVGPASGPGRIARASPDPRNRLALAWKMVYNDPCRLTNNRR